MLNGNINSTEKMRTDEDAIDQPIISMLAVLFNSDTLDLSLSLAIADHSFTPLKALTELLMATHGCTLSTLILLKPPIVCHTCESIIYYLPCV